MVSNKELSTGGRNLRPEGYRAATSKEKILLGAPLCGSDDLRLLLLAHSGGACQGAHYVVLTGKESDGFMLTGTALESSYDAAVEILKRASKAGTGLLGMQPITSDGLLQSALDQSRSELKRAGQVPATKEWLEPQLDSSQGTEKMYSLLEHHIEQPEFLKKLENARDASRTSSPEEHGDEVLHEEWWEEPPHDSNSAPALTEEFTEVTRADVPQREALDSYIIVQKDDVLDAIGTFVAAYLAELPEAQNLQPAQLQAALKTAFKELKKGRVRRLWEWGRMIYRVTAFSYGAFSVYENPWLVRALLAALWTACRMLLRAGTGLPV